MSIFAAAAAAGWRDSAATAAIPCWVVRKNAILSGIRIRVCTDTLTSFGAVVTSLTAWGRCQPVAAPATRSTGTDLVRRAGSSVRWRCGRCALPGRCTSASVGWTAALKRPSSTGTASLSNARNFKMKFNLNEMISSKIVYPSRLVRIAFAIWLPVERRVERRAPTPASVSNSIGVIADDQLTVTAWSGRVNVETLALLGEIELARAARVQFADSDDVVGTADEKVTLETRPLRELTIALFSRFVVDIARNASARQGVWSIPAFDFLQVVHSANGRCHWMLRKLISMRS